MSNSYTNPTLQTTVDGRYPQNPTEDQPVETVEAELVPDDGESIRIVDQDEPGDTTVGDAVIRYAQENIPVDLTDGDGCRFTREQAEKLISDIQEQFYETAKSMQKLRELINEAYNSQAWIALGYEKGLKGWTRMCRERFTPDMIRLTVQQRTDLVLSMHADPISDRALAATLGIGRSTVNRIRADAAGKEGKTRERKPIVGMDGKRHSVVELTEQERRELDSKIYEMNMRKEDGGQGMTQMEIASKLDMAQSSVCASIRRENMRRMSEGLKDIQPADIQEDGMLGEIADDQPLDVPGPGINADDRYFIDAFRQVAESARNSLQRLVELMQSDQWQPGGEPVSLIMDRSGRDLKDILNQFGPFMRLLDHDLDELWPDREDGSNPEQDEVIDLFGEICTVAQQVA